MFSDASFGRPLPMQDEINPKESGNGYALRMVTQNHLMFCDMTRAITSIGHRYLPSAAAQKIAYWFGANPTAVSRAIPFSYKARGHIVTRFVDHEFNRPYHIRLSRPQICARCLVEQRYASAIWDISMVTSCPLHAIQLIDHCPGCRRCISWRRPDLWTCHCGTDFSSDKPTRATSDELWLSQHIEWLVFRESGTFFNPTLSRHVLAAFGLDTLLRVVRALGLSEDGHAEDIVPGRITRILTSEEAQGVLERAFRRLSIILSRNGGAVTGLPLHHSELRTLFNEASDTEATLLHSVLTLVAKKDKRSSAPTATKQQLNLF